MRERLRLFSNSTIAGFGLAVGLGLYLVFPHASLEQRLAESGRDEKADRLTAEYLKVFMKAEPDNIERRLLLADQLARLGSFADARAAVAPLSQSQDQHWRSEADWVALGITETEIASLKQEDPRRAALQADAHVRLLALLEHPLTVERMLALSRRAMAAGDRETAGLLLGRIAASAEKLPAPTYAEAAALVLGFGDYRNSAALYFRAMQNAIGMPARRGYFLSALRTLQSAGLLEEAVSAADKYIDSMDDDPDMLRYLTRLAQAANRPDIAERFVKRLLRISAAPRYQTPQQWLLAMRAPHALQIRRASMQSAQPAPATDALPFDEESYTLGFNVFLANRDLPAALRIAQSAVRQRPDLPEWRKRLAQVSEWSGKPQEALAAWLAYAQQTNDPQAWDAALRLSGGVFDTQTELLALEAKLKRSPGDTKLLDRVIGVYETRGQPERAIELLRNRVGLAGGMAKGAMGTRTPERRTELEKLVALTDRARDDDHQLEALLVLQKEYGPSSAYAFQIASLLYQRRLVKESFAALEVAVDTAAPSDSDYWHAYGQIASQLQDDKSSGRAWRKVLQGNAQTESDLSALFTQLLGPHPRAAARIGEFAFRQFGTVDFASGALAAYVAAGEWAAAQRFIAGLDAPQLAALTRDVSFLATRSAIAQNAGDIRSATRVMRAALQLYPADSDLRAGLIWLLIAGRDEVKLKAALAHWAAQAENSEALWGAYAAAYMTLNRQDIALHWFRKSGFPRNDYLWLMSYAECLDANSQPDLAWRIRRRAWTELRKPEVLAQLPPERLADLRDRLAGLAMLFTGADQGKKVIQAVLRADVKALPAPLGAEAAPADGSALHQVITQMEGQPKNVAGLKLETMFARGSGSRPQDDLRLSATVRELALAWAMNSDADALARGWLASRFTAQMSKPVWGELALLLASDDRQKLDGWLDRIPDWMPMYDRIEAAQRAGRPGLAQSLSFEQLAVLPNDEELHARLTSLTMTQMPALRLEMKLIREAPLTIRQQQAEITARLTPGTELSVGLTGRAQESANPLVLGATPGRDDEMSVALRRKTDSGHITLAAQARNAAASVQGLRLEASTAFNGRLTLNGTAGLNQRAVESPALRVAAMRSGLEGNASLAITPFEFARAGLGWQRYNSQENEYLGSGRNWNLEAGSHLRVEYPNLTLRAFAAGNSFTDSGEEAVWMARFAPLFAVATPGAPLRWMPAGGTTFGFGLSAGTLVDNVYTRAWRPYGDLSLMYNRATGRTFSFAAGITGSLFGQDGLALRFQRSSGTPEIPAGFQELGILYKWFY